MSTHLRWPGLEGKRALVTGGTRGIGRAVVEHLVRSGAKVVLTSRSAEQAEQVADEIRSQAGADADGDCVKGLALDLSQPDSAEEIVTGLAKESRADGGIPLLVLNAGTTRDGLLMRMSREDWNSVVTTNLTGAFLVTKALLPGMIRARSGRIVAVSSVVGRMGNPGQSNYAASKAGLEGFIRSVAREVASRGITANTVAPGFIDTDMTRALPEAAVDKLVPLIPLGRLGEVDDVAGAVAFLLSEAAAYITGEVLAVNGGMDM